MKARDLAQLLARRKAAETKPALGEDPDALIRATLEAMLRSLEEDVPYIQPVAPEGLFKLPPTLIGPKELPENPLAWKLYSPSISEQLGRSYGATLRNVIVETMAVTGMVLGGVPYPAPVVPSDAVAAVPAVPDAPEPESFAPPARIYRLDDD